ncbi:MAG TPA: polyprenyl synthetase family protein, partial [Polyangiaceae bacterium]|nr:polyprenyl synthetase family protein [Polyangiaceae bacterium]
MNAGETLLPEVAKKAFKDLLAKTKPAVEARMGELFDERMRARKSNGREVAQIVTVAKDLSLRGGKRFRAALLASAYFGANPRGRRDVAVAGGVALEMLQSYLLVQDDWMDGDVERRGGPSAHVWLARTLGKGPLPSEQAGAIGAILAGDLIWGLAVEALGAAKAEPLVCARAVVELVRIHEDVVAGQVLDTLAKKADVELLHDLKTGSYTVRGPLALGAILGGADKRALTALAKYAEPLGVAFQLRDDLLGVFGTEEESGRPAGSDLMAGRRSAVMRHALPRLKGDGKRAVGAVWGRRASPRARV